VLFCIVVFLALFGLFNWSFDFFRLPLTRIYAQYFGGRMHLVSLQGHGVDVYLKLKQLEHVEDLQI
jgi:hypothetical protein